MDQTAMGSTAMAKDTFKNNKVEANSTPSAPKKRKKILDAWKYVTKKT